MTFTLPKSCRMVRKLPLAVPVRRGTWKLWTALSKVKRLLAWRTRWSLIWTECHCSVIRVCSCQHDVCVKLWATCVCIPTTTCMSGVCLLQSLLFFFTQKLLFPYWVRWQYYCVLYCNDTTLPLSTHWEETTYESEEVEIKSCGPYCLVKYTLFPTTFVQ